MNKKITIAVLMVMVMACALMFAGCYTVQHEPKTELTPIEALEEAFAQFEQDNYAVDVEIFSEGEEFSIEISMEVSIDGNISHLFADVFGMTGETYYEFAEDGTAWAYEFDEEEGWSKYEFSVENYEEVIVFNEFLTLFNVENFVYDEEKGVFVLAESVIIDEEITSFVLEIGENNTLMLDVEMMDADGYVSTVSMIFCDFGEVELTLPEIGGGNVQENADLAELFAKLEENNYRVEMEMTVEGEGITMSVLMEMAFASNISYSMVNLFGMIGESYYEVTEDGTIWAYESDFEGGWTKRIITQEEYEEAISMDGLNEFFKVENFIYNEEDGTYTLNPDMIEVEGLESFVLWIENGAICVEMVTVEEESFVIVEMTFCDFGEVELNLPEAEEPDALEMLIEKLYGGNATLSVKQTNADESVINSVIKADTDYSSEYYEIEIDGEVYYVAMNYETDEYYIYRPDGEGGYIKEDSDYFGLYDITEQVVAYSYVTNFIYEENVFIYSEEEGKYVLTEEAAEMLYEDYCITDATFEIMEDGTAVLRFVVEGEFEAEVVFSDIGTTSVEIPA